MDTPAMIVGTIRKICECIAAEEGDRMKEQGRASEWTCARRIEKQIRELDLSKWSR